MNILGLYAMGPNTASCLLMDGRLVAFAEEERFCRVKLASDRIPTQSMRWCLKEGGISLAKVDAVTLGWDNEKYPQFMGEFFREHMQHPAKDEYSRIYEEISLLQKMPAFFTRRIEMALRGTGYRGELPPIHYYPHHLCHAYSVFYPSPFDSALVLVMDGSGEEMATSIWIGEGDSVRFVSSIDLPHSLGYFYSALTEYLGFQVFTGEGKVMGLAPYGQPNLEMREKLNRVIHREGDSYRVDPEYVYFAKRNYSFRFTDKLVELFGQPPRVPESEITDWHRQLAWETQYMLEQIVEGMVRAEVQKHGLRNLCVAGGVAMNCKLNGHLSCLSEVDEYFVIPASTDAGCALGSALYHARNEPNIRSYAKQITPYTGPSYNRQAIEAALQEAKISHARFVPDEELYDLVASKIQAGQIVGWFQGKMEVGARALGNRSILADPSRADMKDEINRRVKHREGFRPFAPAIMLEHADDYLQIKGRYIPFHTCMLKSAVVRSEVKHNIPAVVHVDQSVRPQIVSTTTNPRFHQLLSSFYRRTGVPVLLNTSFNVRSEPIVCTPLDALRCFYSTGLDLLVMENYVLEKGQAP